ncbi:hypothetical protein B484DRAFT_462934 [Ochromonadaceae sp. CCMP2298]|nr:hypothetical protein B484DRAFT_462934 [Ochromonadaceae sp. CCMP2298]
MEVVHLTWVFLEGPGGGSRHFLARLPGRAEQQEYYRNLPGAAGASESVSSGAYLVFVLELNCIKEATISLGEECKAVHSLRDLFHKPCFSETLFEGNDDESILYQACCMEAFYVVVTTYGPQTSKRCKKLSKKYSKSYDAFLELYPLEKRCKRCGGGIFLGPLRRCRRVQNCSTILHRTCIADSELVLQQDIPFQCVECFTNHTRLPPDFSSERGAFKVGVPYYELNQLTEMEVDSIYFEEGSIHYRVVVCGDGVGNTERTPAVVNMVKQVRDHLVAAATEISPVKRNKRNVVGVASPNMATADKPALSIDTPALRGKTDRDTIIRTRQLYQLHRAANASAAPAPRETSEPCVGTKVLVPPGHIILFHPIIHRDRAGNSGVAVLDTITAENGLRKVLAEWEAKLAERMASVTEASTAVDALRLARKAENDMYKTLVATQRDSCQETRMALLRKFGEDMDASHGWEDTCVTKTGHETQTAKRITELDPWSIVIAAEEAAGKKKH